MKNLIAVWLLVCLGSVVYGQTTPQWLWAVRAGGTGNDYCFNISRDNAGNLYVTGKFLEVAQFGGTQITSSGGNDIYVAKLDHNGNWLWAMRAGGTGTDQSSSISTDGSGNSYVTGYFNASADFGGTTLTSSGGQDTFIAKLDTNGNWLWAQRAGGVSHDQGLCVEFSEGYCYLTGDFSSTASFGGFSLFSAGSVDSFIARLDANGNWLWVDQAGGTGSEEGDCVSIDPAGNCYIGGYFQGTASFGPHTLTANGHDVYIAKLDQECNWLWATSGGGAGIDGPWSISTDDSGYSNVTGPFQYTAVFGSTTLNCLGSQDVFIARLDANGNWLWAKRAGGTAVSSNHTDSGTCIALDNNGNCLVTGHFYGADADFGSTVLTNRGLYDLFVAKLDIDGNWVWVISGGSTSNDSSYGICYDGEGGSYAAGQFSETVHFSQNSLISAGERDIWVGKLSSGVPGDDELAPGPDGLSSLSAAYPNPFRQGGSTLIKANIAERESGVLTICNLRGQTVQSHRLDCGEHEISLNGSGLPAGIYLYQLKTQTVSETRKVVILK